jgi:hypothetical protein
MAELTKQDVKEVAIEALEPLREIVRQGFLEMNERLDRINARFDQIIAKFEKLEASQKEIELRLNFENKAGIK